MGLNDFDQCAVDGCGRKTADWQSFCPRCYFWVPDDMKRKLYKLDVVREAAKIVKQELESRGGF